MELSPRAMMSLLLHGPKAVDLLTAALDLGILARLDAGPVSLGELAGALSLVPGRLYKLLDGLESLGLVERRAPTDDPLQSEYRSRDPLLEAAQLVLGPGSIERDRDRYDWRRLHGRMPEVLRGELSIPPEVFAWPPADAEQQASFEASMSAGMPPIIESFRGADAVIWADLPADARVLDVGGGEGTLAEALLHAHPRAQVDVLNLPAIEPLVRARAARGELEGRLGFVGGDFLQPGAIPGGYDVILFVRVLHDWPADVARKLLVDAHAALAPGGRLVISEEMRDAERLAVQFFWTYFLLGVDGCVSRLRESSWYERALGEIGFRSTRLLAGAFDILVAER